jgi:hypothetical protein
MRVDPATLGELLMEMDDERVVSGQVPRMVNKLCDFGIVYAVAAELRTVDASLIREVLKDGLFMPLPGKVESAN